MFYGGSLPYRLLPTALQVLMCENRIHVVAKSSLVEAFELDKLSRSVAVLSGGEQPVASLMYNNVRGEINSV